MGLLEDLTTIGSYRTGGRCAIGRIYHNLIETEGRDVADTFAERCRDQSIDQTSLVAVMRAHGHELGKNTLARHRRGDCLCRSEVGI